MKQTNILDAVPPREFEDLMQRDESMGLAIIKAVGASDGASEKLVGICMFHKCYYTLRSSLHIARSALIDDKTSRAHHFTADRTCCEGFYQNTTRRWTINNQWHHHKIQTYNVYFNDLICSSFLIEIFILVTLCWYFSVIYIQCTSASRWFDCPSKYWLTVTISILIHRFNYES